MSLTRAFLIVLFLFAGNAFAQSEQQIRLLDEESSFPIEGATFQYGTQFGTSSGDGVITFNLTETDTMYLSHVSYGEWEWSPIALNQVVSAEVYYRPKIVLGMYPVTVIAVRNSNQQPDERLSIDYQDRMAHDGAELLNQLPAFTNIRKSGNYGVDPVFRGYKYDQLNIVLNGAQSATAACPNRMDPPTSQMAPNMMDRIEVLKGPYALRYGTGFGATINFIPSKLRFTANSEIYGRFSTGTETNGNIYRSEGQIGFSGNVYDVSLFGSWSLGGDYKAGNGAKMQADFIRSSIGTNLGLKVADNQQLRISATYNMARDADFPALPMDLRDDDTWLFNVRHDIQIDGDHLQSWNTSLFGSFVDHRMDNLLKVLDPRMMDASTVATTRNFGGRTESVWNFGGNKFFAGADLRVEGAEGTRTRYFLTGIKAGNSAYDNVWQDGQIAKTGLFAEYHLHSESFNYVLSGRLEINSAQIDNADARFENEYSETQITDVNPSFSLGVQKPIGTDFTAGLWLGRVQRSGSLTERYINYFPVGLDPYEIIGNPNVSPEVNNQIDLVFDWKNTSTAINLDIFASYLQDYIISEIEPNLIPMLPTSPGVRRITNLDEAMKTGFELNWVQELGFSIQHQAGFAYTYAQDLDNKQPLPEIPPFEVRYVLKGAYLNGDFSPEISFRHAMKQTRISQEYGERSTPAFTLLDLNIGYRITHFARVNAGVNNLFDENYYEHLTRAVRGTTTPIYSPGRTVIVNLSLDF